MKNMENFIVNKMIPYSFESLENRYYKNYNRITNK